MIPADHPIRTIKKPLNEVLAKMDAYFDEIYAANGRPSIPPERLLLAKVLMSLYSIRSERQFLSGCNMICSFAGFWISIPMRRPSITQRSPKTKSGCCSTRWRTYFSPR